MEHFVLFAFALTVIAFLSVILAKPIASYSEEEEGQAPADENLPLGQLNYIPTTINPNLPEHDSLSYELGAETNPKVANPKSDFQFASNQLTNTNRLIHEKNWI